MSALEIGDIFQDVHKIITYFHYIFWYMYLKYNFKKEKAPDVCLAFSPLPSMLLFYSLNQFLIDFISNS